MSNSAYYRGFIQNKSLEQAISRIGAAATEQTVTELIVGLSVTQDDYTEEAFIWDEVNGMRNLRDVLTNNYGLNLTGWILREATAISDDGMVIVGKGQNPSGQNEAWLVDLHLTIDDVLTFFDNSVDAETLTGNGPGKSAENRLNAFRKMLVKADDMIDKGNFSAACNKLDTIYNKCDGEPKPKDFVAGSSAPVLADMINELMISLECE